MFYPIIVSLLDVLPAYFAFTGLLPNSFSYLTKFAIYFYLVATTILFRPFSGSLTTIPYILGVFLFIWFMGKRNLLYLVLSLLGYVLSAFLNILVVILLNSLFDITVTDIREIYFIPFSIGFSVFLYFTFLFLRKKVILKQRSVIEKYPFRVLLLLLGELIACALIYIANVIYGEKLGYPPDMIQFNGILFLIFFFVTGIIVFFILKLSYKEKKMLEQLMEYQALKEYTQKLEELYLNIRSFKHDQVNLLASMNEFIREKDWDSLTNFYYQKILPHADSLTIEDTKLGMLSKIKIPELKSLLCFKVMEALHAHLSLLIDIPEEIIEVNAPLPDLVRIIGIFLDNAIEATKLSKEQSLMIGVLKIEQGVSIIIQNTFSENQKTELDKLNKNGYSTKGEGRGIGLYSANKLIAKHKNMLHQTSVFHHTFTQRLDILP